MKAISILVISSILSVSSFAQERIFAIGYAKTFVTKDSSSISFTADLNRVPGKSETAGSYYFVNEVINEKWGFYLKPSLDINLGSSTSTAPNNVSAGLPFGFAYDFKQGKGKKSVFSFFIEAAPEMVSDKSFKNSLYYGSVGPYLKYEVNSKNALFNVSFGGNIANGVRYEIESSSNFYSRITAPLYIKLTCWNAVRKPGKPDEKKFRRISFTNSAKYNWILNDKPTTENSYFYDNAKLDFYIIPNFGINIGYNYGNEEPLFKKNNSITVGIVIARI